MDQKLREKVENVFKGHKLASLATIKDGKPWVRYVMTTGDGMSLYINTHRKSRKVEQINKNENVHVVLGFSGNMENPEYVQVDGIAELVDDPETKKKMWVEYLKKFFKGVDDPDYTIIKISPRMVEYYGKDAMEPQVLNFS